VIPAGGGDQPSELAVAALVLILAGLLRCAIPAHRVDPVAALRCD
jgi:hypothetical protein